MRTWPVILSFALSACTIDDDADGPLCPRDADVPADAPNFIDAPSLGPIPPQPTYQALRQLLRVEALLLEAFTRDGQYPAATMGATPSVACCAFPGHMCAPDAALWTGVWATLGFSIDEPHAYTFRYSGTPSSVQVTIEGDLDCDGIPSTLVLACTAVASDATCTQVYPAFVD